MKPTKEQKDRRNTPFKFTYKGGKAWFYLCDKDGASFHQPTSLGQQNVHGLRISTLINALKKCGHIVLLLLCLPAVVEAGTDLNCTMVDGACAEFGEKASGKKVTIPYEDFLVMLSKVEHSEKLRNKALAENGVLVKIKAEQEVIITLQAKQIEACEAIVKSHEKLGETQEQINKAIEQKLAELTGELTREKRLSRYKSEAFWMGVIGVGLWILN